MEMKPWEGPPFPYANQKYLADPHLAVMDFGRLVQRISQFRIDRFLEVASKTLWWIFKEHPAIRPDKPEEMPIFIARAYGAQVATLACIYRRKKASKLISEEEFINLCWEFQCVESPLGIQSCIRSEVIPKIDFTIKKMIRDAKAGSSIVSTCPPRRIRDPCCVRIPAPYDFGAMGWSSASTEKVSAFANGRFIYILTKIASIFPIQSRAV